MVDELDGEMASHLQNPPPKTHQGSEELLQNNL